MDDTDKLRAAAAALPYSACPLEGVATAGQPRESDWRALAEAGYRTVVDLRTREEMRGHDEGHAVRAAGLDYVLIPVTPATLGDEQFDEFRALMRDPDKRPVLVHCATANRVGALLLPYLVLDEHQSPEDALRLARHVGLRGAEYASMAMDYARRRAPTAG